MFELSTLVALLLVGSVAGAGIYLRTYIGKKAENLATKEDVALLTRKVESVKSSFRIQEESVKAALAKDVTAHEARFAMELPIYREIWELYLAVDVALDHVRIAARVGTTTQGKSRQEAYADFQAALAMLKAAVRRQEPFFAPEVNDAIMHATLPLRMIAVLAAKADGDNEAALEVETKQMVSSMSLLSSAIRARLHADALAASQLMPVISTSAAEKIGAPS
jgi:hypothetical protein